MFDKPYNYEFKVKNGKSKGAHMYTEHVYTFRAFDRKVYIIEVEEYHDPHVYVLKFYLKAHRDSPNKYKLLTNTGDVSRKLATFRDLMYELYMSNPYSSFGFIGINSEGEELKNTKRFRVYSRFMATFFSTTKFEHHIFEDLSCYFLLNRDNSDPDILHKAETLFMELYDPKESEE